MTPFRLMWFSSYGARRWDEPDYGIYDWRDPAMYCDMAGVLERRGRFDAVVFADSPAMTEIDGDRDIFLRRGIEGNFHDPVPMLAAMATATRSLGLVGTLSTTTYPPYLLARLFATFDHLSSGRAGWNIVTSIGDHVAQNFGLDRMWDTDERYRRAEEFVTLTRALWESWEPGAVLLDRDSGRFADPTKVHEVNFAGEYFRSRGPLTLPRSPQGGPVLMQAGASESGRDFAARHAELIVSHRDTPEAMKAFREDIRDRMKRLGRDPDSCKIFFTVAPVVGDTPAEARARRAERRSRPTAGTDVGLAMLSTRIGFDVRGLPLDEPLDPEALDGAVGGQGVIQQHTEGEHPPTLREIAELEAMKETCPVEGDPEQVATRLAEIMDFVGGDGIAVRDTMLPSSVVPFVDRVVPLLRERGLVRTGYHHPTFRENLMDPDFAVPAAVR